MTPMQQLRRELIKLADQWDENILSDEEFDFAAVKAVREWAKQQRREILGEDQPGGQP